MSKTDFIGVWKLVNYTTILDDSKKTFTHMGKNPLGYLIYTQEGLCFRPDYEIRSITSPAFRLKRNHRTDDFGVMGRYEIRKNSVASLS